MKLLAFSVYDEKAEAFMQPFFTATTGIATRNFGEWARNKDSMIGRHPEDFKLYNIGTYSDVTGTFENVPAPLLIGTAMQYLPDQMLKKVKTSA